MNYDEFWTQVNLILESKEATSTRARKLDELLANSLAFYDDENKKQLSKEARERVFTRENDTFPLTAVSREDFSMHGWNGDNVTDEDMIQLASDISSACLDEEVYWTVVRDTAEKLKLEDAEDNDNG